MGNTGRNTEINNDMSVDNNDLSACDVDMPSPFPSLSPLQELDDDQCDPFFVQSCQDMQSDRLICNGPYDPVLHINTINVNETYAVTLQNNVSSL